MAIKKFFGFSKAVEGMDTAALIAQYGYTRPNQGVVIYCNGVPTNISVESVTQAQGVVDHLNKKRQGHFTYHITNNTMKAEA